MGSKDQVSGTSGREGGIQSHESSFRLWMEEPLNQYEQDWGFAAWSSEDNPSTPFTVSRNAANQEEGHLGCA